MTASSGFRVDLTKGFVLLWFSFCLSVSCSTYASTVAVTGEEGKWTLEVDGRPFYAQGVGCSRAKGADGASYLKMASELGANCVRTWGPDQGNREYLDLANFYGLKVACGFWLESDDGSGRLSYERGSSYRRMKKNEILRYVREFKNHPAVLMWIVGNETIFFASTREEKAAVARFIEEVAGEIHALDPRHPVAYASAGANDLSFLTQFTPSLDIIGINEFRSIDDAHGAVQLSQAGKPYLITEYGPPLPADCPRDENGQAVEPTDEAKASRYRDFAQRIRALQGHNLGGFAFHLGASRQDSMTWWNINEGSLRRAAFAALYESFTGRPATFRAPVLLGLELSKTQDLASSQAFRVSAQVQGDPQRLRFRYRLSTCREDGRGLALNSFVPADTFGQGPEATVEAPRRGGSYRVICYVEDENGSAASLSRSIFVEGGR